MKNMTRQLLFFTLRFLAIILLIFNTNKCCAQTKFKGIVINSSDSLVVPFAAVKAVELNQDVLTNENGEFSFSIPEHTRRLTFEIAAIGLKTSVECLVTKQTQKIFVRVAANDLNEVAINGLSAAEIVKKAIALIPVNYADSSYFNWSYYRRYQKRNDRYVNLYEAQPIVMFRLTNDRHRIYSKEAFAVKHVRTSRFHPNISNVIEDNPDLLLLENPIYHLETSSLNPDRFPNYQFSFDTSSTANDYVINYVSRQFSSETHGLGNYEARDLKGEQWEKGQLVIDRETFSIKKYNRVSLRYKDYSYKFKIPNNKVTFAHHEYFFEFKDAELLAEYEPINGKWYLSKLAHRYSVDFHIPIFYTRDCSIDDFFEWNSHSVSRYITGEFLNQFYPKAPRPYYDYESDAWNINFPFFFRNKDSVYADLAKDGPIDQQFIDGIAESNERIEENKMHKKK